MKINILIPMAGLGTRFKNEGFNLPKPLIEVNGKTLIEHSVSTLGIEGQYIFITRQYDEPAHNELLSAKLKQLYPTSTEITLSQPTRGSVETCLAAAKLINTDDPLIITNCDQITDWDAAEFLEFVSQRSIAGAIVTYTSSNPKNSFAVVEGGRVVEVVEKNPVTDIALIGLHYWKHGEDFVRTANELMKSFKDNGRPECYISETYNYLIQEGRLIKNFHIDENQYISLGTPYDLTIYQGKVKEFYTDKPKTIFCDIDGTLLKHVHKFSELIDTVPKLLDGVREKINQWDSQGHKIILVTARKESAREMTEKHLRDLGLCWDHLIMGVTSGNRILINDKLNKTNPDRSQAVNVITNSGFGSIDWDNYGL